MVCADAIKGIFFGGNNTVILCASHYPKFQVCISFQKDHVEVFQQWPMLHLKAGARRSMSLVKQFATSVMKDFRSLVPLKFFAEGEIGQHHQSVKV